MSLVYEALQKAAQENKRRAVPPPRPVTPLAPSVPAPAAPSRLPVVWITGLSLVTVIGLAWAVIGVTRKPTLPTAPVTGVPPVTSAAPVAAPESATVPPAPVDTTTANDQRFKLTGIMQLGEKYSAVVNGHVVAPAQYVDGAIVKSVERDRVTLTVDGREVVLRLF